MEEVKKMLRSVLQSSKEGVPAHILQRDYRDITEQPLPFRNFGFNNLDDFIASMPDIVCIKRNKAGEIMYHAVATEETLHIQKMVSKQKSAKKKRNIKPASRRPKLLSHTRPPPKPRPPRSPIKGASPGRSFSNMPCMISPYGGSPMQPSQFQVILNRGDGHRSVVQSGMGRALHGALEAASKERQQHQPKPYEVPPRFRRLQGKQTPATPTRPTQPASTSRTPPHGKSSGSRKRALQVAKVVDGQKYFHLVAKYMENRKLPLKFDTIPSKMNNRDFYASSIKMDGEVYGSEDIFGTQKDAEYAVCRTICEKLNLLQTTSSSDDPGKSQLIIPEAELKSRVKKIVQGKTNGLWSTRLAVVYKEEFNEPAPDNILYLVKKWTDIVKVEAIEVTGRDIIYPVKEDLDKNRELQIPLAPTLPLMQEVTVFSTFINNCGHFYVQKEDSPIDEIVKELEKISKAGIMEFDNLFDFLIPFGCTSRNEKIRKTSHIPSPEYQNEGCHCAALFLEDNSWSRAEIISCGDNILQTKMKAMFLDYGNEEYIEPGATRWLNEKAASYPAQAISCYLRGINYLDDQDNWSKESTVEFARIVHEKALIAITHAYDENGFCEVDLFLASDPSVNVNQKLIDEGLVKNMLTVDRPNEVYNGISVEPGPLVYPSEDQWDVYVSFVNQTTDFVMMRLVGEEYSEKLDELEFCLEQAFHKAPEEQAIEVGMVCVAYVESLYHRVRVLDIGEKWIECYFLDHGDTDRFIADQLRILDPKINTSLAYQGFEASLYGLEDVAQNSAALEKLFDVALGKTCVAEIVSRDEGFSVILYDTSGKDDVNINDLILKTVSAEAESSLLVASQTVSPAGSVSSIPDKVKPDSAKSSKQSSPALPRKNISSSKPSSKDSTANTSPSSTCSVKDKKSVISEQIVLPKTSSESKQTAETQKFTSDTSKVFENNKNTRKLPTKVVPLQEETEDGSDSWETESEEEFLEQDSEEEEVKMDHNSNLKFTSIDEICDAIDNKCEVIKKSSSPSPPSSDMTSLYTWNCDSNVNSSQNDDEEFDDSKLWISKEYHKFHLPVMFSVPPSGEFCDIHVSFVFDPTNFVCNPYESLTELNDLHQEMYHYFNTHHSDKELSDEDLKLGHLYAGEQGGLWYRIIVNKIINPGLVSVYNVDYGEYNAMTLDEIKPLPWRFWKLPQQAFKGRLIDIQPAGGAQVWSEAAKYKMTQMAQDRNLVGLVCGVDDAGVVSLKLVDTSSEEDVCLHEVLLDLGYAELITTPHPHGHD